MVNSLDFKKDLIYNSKCYADMAELADAQVSGSCGRPCRFNSCYPHQTSQNGNKMLVLARSSFNENLNFNKKPKSTPKFSYS